MNGATASGARSEITRAATGLGLKAWEVYYEPSSENFLNWHEYGYVKRAELNEPYIKSMDKAIYHRWKKDLTHKKIIYYYHHLKSWIPGTNELNVLWNLTSVSDWERKESTSS